MCYWLVVWNISSIDDCSIQSFAWENSSHVTFILKRGWKHQPVNVVFQECMIREKSNRSVACHKLGCCCWHWFPKWEDVCIFLSKGWSEDKRPTGNRMYLATDCLGDEISCIVVQLPFCFDASFSRLVKKWEKIIRQTSSNWFPACKFSSDPYWR